MIFNPASTLFLIFLTRKFILDYLILNKRDKYHVFEEKIIFKSFHFFTTCTDRKVEIGILDAPF